MLSLTRPHASACEQTVNIWFCERCLPPGQSSEALWMNIPTLIMLFQFKSQVWVDKSVQTPWMNSHCVGHSQVIIQWWELLIPSALHELWVLMGHHSWLPARQCCGGVIGLENRTEQNFSYNFTRVTRHRRLYSLDGLASGKTLCAFGKSLAGGSWVLSVSSLDSGRLSHTLAQSDITGTLYEGAGSVKSIWCPIQRPDLVICILKHSSFGKVEVSSGLQCMCERNTSDELNDWLTDYRQSK